MPSTPLRDGSSVSDPRLDRLVQFDEKSRSFPLTALLDASEQQPRTKTWWVPKPVLDQGTEGRCVEFGICHDLRSRPRVRPMTVVSDILAHKRIYHRAQHIDYWSGCHLGQACDVQPSEDRYEGTSVLAGMQALTELGLAEEYRWCFGIADLMLALSWKGPSVIGVNWYQGMYGTDDRGWIHVDGDVMGGHCLLVTGINVRQHYFTLLNSWGPSWGRNGRAKISFDDMERLLHEDGEVVIPLGLKER